MFEKYITKSIRIKPWCVTIGDAVRDYPRLRDFLDKNDRLDFGDPHALSEYNKAVAFSLASLKISVAENHLIPAVCLRHAYGKILAEDYLSQSSHVLEIGTGASAIISLLMAKLYNYTIVASEINSNSLQQASNNVIDNHLSQYISLVKSDGGILDDVIEHNSKFDAILTYPPTYRDNMSNLGKLNKKRGFKGVYSEMIGGGETGFDFTQQYLTEACSHRYDIRLVTVLCLAKEHIVPAITILESHGRSVDLIELIAGTRKRYLIIGDEKK